MDSHNGINHKCPCCGYETEWDWKEGKFIQGDESFVKIGSGIGRTSTFETDKPKQVDYGPQDYESAYLLGCPKCGCVSFVIW